MMDCSTFKELSGLRPDDLVEDERAGVREHLARCEVCAEEQRFDEELLSLVDRLPVTESTITAADIRRADGIEALTVTAAPPVRRRTAQSVAQVALALAALVAVALLLVPGLRDREETPGQRLKGAAMDPSAPTAFSLQFSVESTVMNDAAVAPGVEQGAYGPEQGFIFGVQTDTDGELLLAEEGPDGSVRIIGPSGPAGWHAADGGVLVLADDAGQHLTYRPDGPDGTYRYTALLASPPSREIAPGEVRALLEGEPVTGVTLLASDSFAVEWSLEEAGEEVH